MTTIENLEDIEMILDRRHDNGADYWTTTDCRLIKGSPFSLLESVSYLLELGMPQNDPVLQEATKLILNSWQPDGRYKLSPKGGIYPCHTTHAASILCQMGYAEDKRLLKTWQHLLETQEIDGGWRCKKFSYGRGPETDASTPHPTLLALDSFRFSEFKSDKVLEKAIDFLLSHWETKAPLGPCHYGIGTLFMQIEYPFRGYGLFYYVYILSFYEYARKDQRYLEAFRALEDKLVNNQIIVERVVPKLRTLNFCQKDQPSELATKKFQEILVNMQM